MDSGTELADWAIKRKRDPSILIRELQKDIIASPHIADPTFGVKKSIYTDFFASSKPLKRFETIMIEKVLPFYANTHTSTTSTSKCTSSSVKKARETVARCTNAISTVGHEHQVAVIFSGDGSTSAINKIRNVFRLGDEAYWIRRIPQESSDLSLLMIADQSLPTTKRPTLCVPTSVSYTHHSKQDTQTASSTLHSSVFSSLQQPFCGLPDKYRPAVFISIQEHHSNLLPWRESCADLIVVPETSSGQLDLVFLEEQLIRYHHRPLKLGSFSAGSNLTGVLNDTVAISELLHKYGAFAFYDYAGVGPYTTIDMNPAPSNPSMVSNSPNLAYKDGVFLSTHKFLGGPGASGILVARLEVFSWTENHRGPPSPRSISASQKSTGCSSIGTSASAMSKSSLSLSSLSSTDSSMEKSEWLPTNPGGGTVDMVIQGRHKCTNNILAREEAGTPNILATIRTGLVFTLQEIIRPSFIIQEEYRLAKKVLSRLLDPALDGAIQVLGNPDVDRVAVFSLTIAVPRNVVANGSGRPRLQIHYALLSTLMNDFFGIEMRGGCMCAGPYASQLLKFDAEKEIKFWNLLLGEDLAQHDDNLETEESNHPGLNDNASQGDRPTKTNIHQHDLCSKSLKPGFVRFSFSYFAKDKDVDFVIRSLEWVAHYGYLLVPLYKVDASSGEWSVRPSVRRAVLSEISPKRLSNPSRENCIPIAIDCINILSRLFRDQQGHILVGDGRENTTRANVTMSTMQLPLELPVPGAIRGTVSYDNLQVKHESDFASPSFQPSRQLNWTSRRSAKLSYSVKQAKRSVGSALSNVWSMVSATPNISSVRPAGDHPGSARYPKQPPNVFVSSIENIVDDSPVDYNNVSGNAGARLRSSSWLSRYYLPASRSEFSSIHSDISGNTRQEERYSRSLFQSSATPPATPLPSGPYSFTGAQPSVIATGTTTSSGPLNGTAVSAAAAMRLGGISAVRYVRPKDPQMWVNALQELEWGRLEQELQSIETSPLAKELRWFVTPLEVARIYAREVKAGSPLSSSWSSSSAVFP